MNNYSTGSESAPEDVLCLFDDDDNAEPKQYPLIQKVDKITTDSSSDTDGYDTENEKIKQPKMARKKRKVCYNKHWEEKYNWLKKSSSVEYAQCTLCICSFTISHGGENDIKKHMKSNKHNQIVATQQPETKQVTKYFGLQSQSAENLMIAKAEAIHVYHTIIHFHSYNSADCNNSLYAKMFSDSNIACKFSCGRTKTTKIGENVLAAASKEYMLLDLAQNKKFSIATDASNKGNLKMFPLMLRYYKKSTGICIKILKFYNLESETSKHIAQSLENGLVTSKLSLQNVTAYAADNAPVNYGKNQSVFTELLKLNNKIVPLGCPCHILHNTAKKAAAVLRFDVESIIIMCFNEFSSSTKNSVELKGKKSNVNYVGRLLIIMMFFFIELMSWAEEEWSELIRHVPTRWLSLVPAVDRLLKHFKSVKCYFLSKKNPRPYLKKFFEHELAEAYLGFLLNIGLNFQNAIIVLESENTSAINVHGIMTAVLDSLESKKSEKFYGFLASTTLRKCDNDDAVKLFEKEADSYFEKAIQYLKKNFDFDSNLKFLSPMTLKVEPALIHYNEIVEKFQISNVDMDMLFEEFVNLKKFWNEKVFPLTEDDRPRSIDIWSTFLNTFQSPNFEKICDHIFSLPVSNAMSERIFNFMGYSWRKERNRLSIKTVESEIMIKQNFNISCIEFANFLKTKQRENILKNVMSSQKY